MKILKHGNDYETTVNAIFRCYNCECEWLANITTECVQTKRDPHGYLYECLTYVCECPDCGRLNITTKITDEKEDD